jgi:hypothetical protein
MGGHGLCEVHRRPADEKRESLVVDAKCRQSSTRAFLAVFPWADVVALGGSNQMTFSGQPRDRGPAFCTWCGAARHGFAPYCAGCGRAHEDLSTEPSSDAWEETVVLGTTERGEAPGPERAFGWEPVAYDQQPGTDAPSAYESVASRGALRSRWAVVAAVAVAAPVFGWGGMAGAGFLRDRPVHQALDAAAGTYRPIVTSLASVDDFSDLHSAAAQAQRSLPRLRGQYADVQGRSGDLAASAAEVVGSEVAVAEATAALSNLDEQSLERWGDLHAALVRAEREETRSRAGLRAVDASSVAGTPASAGAVNHVEQYVGEAVAGMASQATDELLGQAADVRHTADVRAVASDAAVTAETLDAARAGVDSSSAEGKRLAATTEVLDELAALSSLNGDNLEVWSRTQAPLESALSRLSAEDDTLVASAAGDKAVSALDRLVRQAEETLAEWEASYDAAVQQRADDLNTLDDYAAGMRAELETYDGLRADTSDFVDRIEDPGSFVTYNEAYNEFSQGSLDRMDVRDAMDALTVPGEVQSAHDRLLDVVDDAIAAMDSAYSGLFDAQWCTSSCYYRNTPGWQTFSDESDRITSEFDSATGAWEAAVEAAESSIQDRALPVKPRV